MGFIHCDVSHDIDPDLVNILMRSRRWNTISTEILPHGCTNNGWGADDSTTEIADMLNAITSVSAATGVDERYILATIVCDTASRSIEDALLTQYRSKSPWAACAHQRPLAQSATQA